MNDDHNAKRDVETNRLCTMIMVACGVCTAALLAANAVFNFF